MWFNSFGFWLFFIFVAVVYSRLRLTGQNRWLLVASYFFYGCFDWRFLSLIFFCTALNYHAGIKIAEAKDPKRRKFWIGWSIVISLFVLGIFKYLGFFTREMSALLLQFEVIHNPWIIELMLPAGISFFTFHALSYTIDVYRGETPRAYVTLNDGATESGEALAAWLNPQLGKHERVDSVVVRLALPKTMIGKLSRKDLLAEVLTET